ncbi:hypothetical protein [Succinivibrio dextrinosolvens]|uniref:hypothetical protein n=1 Tax=Succinivibrio dextrinosolvens TaxID=83771 RepID=UPI001923965E|nr:hypothetical protein [Succinivibrio dextrinosolvens]
MFKLKDSKNPYELDMEVSSTVEKTIKIPALTEKNRNFIEAVVKLDSRYGKEAIINKPSDTVLKELQWLSKQTEFVEDTLSFSIIPGEDNYLGSTHYWFDAIKNNLNNDFCNLLGALYNINLTNSTRRSYREIFYKAKNLREKLNNKLDFNTLKNELSKDFSQNCNNHIISYLTYPGQNGACTLSLASKFCSYACEYFGLDKSYSKYDTIVSDNLKYYIDAYLTDEQDLSKDYNKFRDSKFKVNGQGKKFERSLKVYQAYSYFIERIIEKLAVKKVSINKNELDHIIWYSKK